LSLRRSGCPGEGIRIGQQKRKAFGFSWQTKVGTDEDADKGYIIHVVWNATAQPSEKSHETMNDSPDAETFSWECNTVPVNVTGYKDVAVMEFDSTVLTAAQMKLWKTCCMAPTARMQSFPPRTS
jgi:hypothetical protein